MKSHDLNIGQRGIAHIGLLLLVLVVLVVGAVAWRINDSNKTDDGTTSSQTAGNEDTAALDSAEQEADKAAGQAQAGGEEGSEDVSQ